MRSRGVLSFSVVLSLGLALACRPEAPLSPASAPPQPQPLAQGTEPLEAAEPPHSNVPPARAPALGLARVHEVDDSLSDLVDGVRVRVPLGADDPWIGAPEPTVVAVVFFDYECPPCKPLMGSLYELLERYPDDFRVVLKFHPLASHPQAEPAARAAIAAQRQGRFWVMHDELLSLSTELSDQRILDAAGRLGLSLPTFETDWADPEIARHVAVDLSMGRELQVSGVPTYYINGRAFTGAMSTAQLVDIIDDEKRTAQQLLKAGSARNELYARFQRASGQAAVKPKAMVKPQPGRPDPNEHYAVPTDGRPARGPDDAIVTIIEFADFQCPFSNRVRGTLDEVREKFGSDVRVVYRNFPLAFHKQARLAARAALAADRQGKFWKMHARLFENQRSLSDKKVHAIAKALKLDMKRFRRDLKDPEVERMLEADLAVAQRFGVRGTPAFFVNGRFLSGSQPIDKFSELVQEELAFAKKARRTRELPKEGFYRSLIKDFRKRVD